MTSDAGSQPTTDPIRPFILHPINDPFAEHDRAPYSMVRIELVMALVVFILIMVAILSNWEQTVSGLRLNVNPAQLTGVVTARRDFIDYRNNRRGQNVPVEKSAITIVYRVQETDYEVVLTRDRRDIPVLLAIGDSIPIQVDPVDPRRAQWPESQESRLWEVAAVLTIIATPALVVFSFTRTNLLLARHGQVLPAMIDQVIYRPDRYSIEGRFGTLEIKARFVSPTGRKKEVHSLHRLYRRARGIPEKGQPVKVIWYNDNLYRLL